MESVNLDSLVSLENKLKKVLDSLPEEKRKLHEELGEMAKGIVENNISVSVNDGNGKIKNWQEMRIGSKGGYAAISPKKNMYIYNKTNNKKYAVGYITNAIENGHPARIPRNPKTKRRVKVAYVDGRGFYFKSRNEAMAKSIGICNAFVERLKEKIEE
ncbi:MAG: hypothetical protein LKJ25_03110 [Clostridia bacterium]|jgi:hypothetical protein|nr:hypothetical protein [Clostridia bacterium]